MLAGDKEGKEETEEDSDVDEDEEDDGDEDDDDDTEVKEENGVLILTDNNYDTFMEGKDTVLVEFYAPWYVCHSSASVTSRRHPTLFVAAPDHSQQVSQLISLPPLLKVWPLQTVCSRV